MAWGSKGTLGATADKTAGTSIAHTTATTSVSSGNVVIVIIAKDNASTVSGSNTNEVTSVTDSAGNSYSKIYEWTNGQGAANAGVCVAAFYSVATATLGTGGTITANFSDTRTASCLTGWVYTASTTPVVTVQTTGRQTAVVTAGDFSTLTVSGLTSAEYLFLHAMGAEINAVAAAGADGLTEFTAINTTGGGAASNISVDGRFIIATGTSQSSNPGAITASDNVAFMVALSEATQTFSAAWARQSNNLIGSAS